MLRDPDSRVRGADRSGAGRRDRIPDARVLAALVLAALVLAAFVLGSSGCAYFNTFYFAKKYFAQAEKLARAAGSDKVPPDAIRRYDEAIKQATKVIKYHGGSRWVDDALYLMGASFYGKGEHEEALRKFDELVANYPESRWVPWALYKSGLSHYQRKNDELMEACFRRVLNEYPDFERSDDIYYTGARAAERKRDRVEAVRRYRELVERFPRSDRGQEGLLRIGDLYFDAGYADSAYTSYAEASRLARDEQGIRNAEVKAADALVRLQRAPEAVRQLERLLPSDETQIRPGETWPALVRVHLAQAYNATARPADALEALRLVVTKYPQSSYAPEAQFQIGYTYEVYLDSLDAARTAYDQVGRSGSTSVFRDQAQTRSRNLAQLQTLASQAASDSTADSDKQAEAQLRIAELYLLSQNKVSEAIAKYREVRAEYPGSRSAPRAAYALAWIQLRRMEGQRDSALTAFVQLIRDFPTSPAARGALELLAAEGADTAGLSALLVEAPPDTAETDATTPAPAPPSPADSETGVAPGAAPPEAVRPPTTEAPPGVPLADSVGLPPRFSPMSQGDARAGAPADTTPAGPGALHPDSLPAAADTLPPDSLPAGADTFPPDTMPPRPGARLPDTLRAAPDTLPPGPRRP